MSLRTPLGRVRGTGSAGEGVGHWWWVRVSAVALVPLSLWFVLSLTGLRDLEYLTVRSWVGEGWNPILLVAMIGLTVYHSALGLQVVIEDYVHAKTAKLFTLFASTFVHGIVGVACVFAIIKISIS